MYHAILVFDLGLTNCKGIVFSASGEILGRASQAYPTYNPQPGFVEQNPDDWWKAICQVTSELWQLHPELAEKIDVISVTGHMHALVAEGSRGRTLERSLILGDQRSMQSAEQISSELGLPTIYHITGARMDASMPAAKIRWLKLNAPDIHRDTCLFLGCKDYIRRLLTGDALTDPIDACATSLYDIQKCSWSEELMKAAGISESQLPQVGSPVQVAGPLLKEPASRLGLKAGIPVILGTGDDVEVLGNGLMRAGQSLEHLGTTGSILTCVESPIYDPDMALELYPHAQPGLWVIGGSTTTAGSAMAWASQLLGYANLEAAFATLSKAQTPDEYGLPIFLPHLLGERSPCWQPLSRGSWIGLTTTHAQDDLMRAALEGTVFSLKHILERIELLAGVQEIISISGRLDENEAWLKLRANIYDRPLGLTQSTEPTALGAMILAAVGIGLYPDLGTAVAQTTTVDRCINPESVLAEAYAQSYALYSRALTMLTPYWTYANPMSRENNPSHTDK
jgi:xylulokinase